MYNQFEVEVIRTSFVFITVKAKNPKEAEERALNNASKQFKIVEKNCLYGDPSTYEVESVTNKF